MGLSLARKAGLRLALISGENSALIDRLATKLWIEDVYKDCKDKAQALRWLADRHGLHLEDICFMGDDVNDLAALKIAGLAAAPADARAVVVEQCHWVAKSAGGNGAVRELVDYLLTTVGGDARNEPLR
jgi:3-deoxy-D-manno-octulosonate 8-phosphate phosphatase (KDO 8-P phosphatase)